ncbi:MAG: CFI-box-CTERM domain-containing protein [Candidatus Hodarchaeota archaeon]
MSDDDLLKTPEEMQVEETPPPCFIVTAAYSSPLHYKLDVLRKWRDDSLRRTIFGQSLIKLYYTLSPPCAKLVSRSTHLRRLVRSVLNPFISKLQR